MIKPYDFVHLVFHASESGRISGRTKLQKIVYFAGALANLGEGLGYRAHYYGPYSADVSVAVDELRGLGFISQKASGFGIVDPRGFEMTRYDYELTEPGRIVADDKVKEYPEEWDKIKEAIQKLHEAKADDYVKLSIAAKSYFMQKKKNCKLTPKERASTTAEYGWNVTEDEFREADKLLQEIRLV